MKVKDKGVVQILREYANLTDEELAEVNEELGKTWGKILKILKVDVSQLDSEQIDGDYFFWLCFTVGMFRENQFMIDTFGGTDIKKTKALLKKMEDRTKYIA